MMDDNLRLVIADILETVRKLKARWIVIAGGSQTDRYVPQILNMLNDAPEHMRSINVNG